MPTPTIEQLILLFTALGGGILQYRSWRSEQRRERLEDEERQRQKKRESEAEQEKLKQEAREREIANRELETRIANNLAQAYAQDREFANQQISGLRGDITRMEAEVRTLKENKTLVDDELHRVSRELEDTRRRLTNTEQEAKSLRTLNKNLRTRVDMLSERLQKYETLPPFPGEETKDNGDSNSEPSS